jgi:hypothetical protein
MYASPLELTEMPRELGWAEAGELHEIAGEVRLIEESTVEGQAAPIGRRDLPQ